jgi:hypothetical protein
VVETQQYKELGKVEFLLPDDECCIRTYFTRLRVTCRPDLHEKYQCPKKPQRENCNNLHVCNYVQERVNLCKLQSKTSVSYVSSCNVT